MEMVTILENKKVYHILAISGIILLLIVFSFDNVCIFKNIFNIPCISCGLTRGFISIIHFNFIEAINYNVLSIPLFILIIIYYILYIIYLFKNNTLDLFYKYFIKHYKILFLILLISWIINVVKYL